MPGALGSLTLSQRSAVLGCCRALPQPTWGRRMEIFPSVLQGAGIAAREPPGSVYLGSGDADGSAGLVLGVVYKPGGLTRPP